MNLKIPEWRNNRKVHKNVIHTDEDVGVERVEESIPGMDGGNTGEKPFGREIVGVSVMAKGVWAAIDFNITFRSLKTIFVEISLYFKSY